MRGAALHQASLSAPLQEQVANRAAAWDAASGTRRLWQKDATLWTGADEGRWLAWLHAADATLADLPALLEFREQIAALGLTHALLLGMGGSSLCPEVLARTFGSRRGHPDLLVLDSTDPLQVRWFEARLDFARTLFVVASKSGTTLEPEILRAHFHSRARRLLGDERAGACFVAITDPGSQLERVAARDGYRRLFHGVPEIGGRFSALSSFGMVPAAILGLDLERLLERARAMAAACGPEVPARENPGVALGITLGALALRGIDKLTLIGAAGLDALGAWLEQLVAESTGKHGKAIIPVDREPLAAPEWYGDDRVFVQIRLAGAPDGEQDAAVARLEQAGRPVLRIDVPDKAALAAEFFRWEIATAVAGAVLGIHPFDQPDVEAAKTAARKVTAEFERSGALPAEAPFHEEGGLRLFADPQNAAAIRQAAPQPSLAGFLGAHLRRARPGDYVALLAFVPMTGEHERRLQDARRAIRDALRVATCLGFGPRFLHSTGQAYKGGPATGVFVQVTCDDAEDVDVPGQRLTFGVVKAAQARGDLQVLAERGRRALRVHIAGDVACGLDALARAVQAALARS
jgi:transaldolase/glucose-6-phosphate isomerase